MSAKDTIDARSADLIRDSIVRYRDYTTMARKADTDAAVLSNSLKGKRYQTAHGLVYEIAEIKASYDGTMRARGWKVKTDGKLGSQLWDIGVITLKGFSNLLDDGRPA